MEDCRGLSADRLHGALAKLRHVQSLCLDGITEVDDDLVTALAGCCPSLRRLSLNRCAAVGDASLEALASALPALQELRLDWVTKVGYLSGPCVASTKGLGHELACA